MESSQTVYQSLEDQFAAEVVSRPLALLPSTSSGYAYTLSRIEETIDGCAYLNKLFLDLAEDAVYTSSCRELLTLSMVEVYCIAPKPGTKGTTPELPSL